MPKHAGGSQHLNVGLDFFTPEDVVWQAVSEYTHVAKVPLGVRMHLPEGFHMQFAPRSGLAINHNVLATCGVIDSSFRGEPVVQLICFNRYPPQLPAGSKIVQGLVFRSEDYNVVEGKVDIDTARGEAGFGSTGT